MNNMRQVRVNRHDATSLYVNLFDKLTSGQVYNIPKIAANTVTVTNANFALLTTIQLPAGRIGIFGGNASTLPKNGNIVMANLVGAVGTGSTNTVVDGFGNVVNMVKITDPTKNEPLETPNDYPTINLRGRQIYGLLQAANGVSNDTAVGTTANCQISFVTFDSSGALQLVNVNQAIEFDTNQFRDHLHVPVLIKHGADQIDDALTGGDIEYIERRFYVTAPVTVGSKLNINNGLVVGTGSTNITTFTDGGQIISNLNIKTSGSSFTTSPSLVILDNGVHMKKGAPPVSNSEEVVWESPNEISFYRVLDAEDEISIRIPFKNNQ